MRRDGPLGSRVFLPEAPLLILASHDLIDGDRPLLLLLTARRMRKTVVLDSKNPENRTGSGHETNNRGERDSFDVESVTSDVL